MESIHILTSEAKITKKFMNIIAIQLTESQRLSCINVNIDAVTAHAKKALLAVGLDQWSLAR